MKPLLTPQLFLNVALEMFRDTVLDGLFFQEQPERLIKLKLADAVLAHPDMLFKMHHVLDTEFLVQIFLYLLCGFFAVDHRCSTDFLLHSPLSRA